MSHWKLEGNLVHVTPKQLESFKTIYPMNIWTLTGWIR